MPRTPVRSTSNPSLGTHLRRLVGSWVPPDHEPTERQQAALEDPSRAEILYGGAAGGGKSDWLLMEALRYADVPGYAALILRRTYPMLSKADGLISRSRQWLSGTSAEWLDRTNTWTFPSGATLEFGHLQHENDKYNYQGPAYQFVGFDELTQFNESQYLYLFSRLRRLAESTLPVRMRSSSNPGGVGHDWVRQRFLIEEHPDRCFIAAKLSDNPYLDREQYEASLHHLHPFERAQLLEGNWDVRPPGARFRREWFPRVDVVLDDAQRVRFWDCAATAPKPGTDPDYTVGLRMAKARDVAAPFRRVIEDVVRLRGTPREVDAAMLRTARADGIEVSVRIEQEPGASGKIAMAHFRTLLEGFDVRGVPATGKKVVRANPVASNAQAGDIAMLRASWNEELMRELEQFTGTDQDAHDDQVDALSGAYAALSSSGLSPADLYGEPSQVSA